MKVFSSGSCRLVTTINNGHGKVTPIHSMFYNFVGCNFMGKFHNTKQHIQFIQWINDEIELPQNILQSFLTSYGFYQKLSKFDVNEPLEMNPIKKKNIKDQFNSCDCYIFEICSLKLYMRDGYQVQWELTNHYTESLQSESELYNDLKILCGLIPKGKKIIFQSHFRPNIIYNDPSKVIENREIIYNNLKKFCETEENVYLYDPSILLHKNKSLFDGDVHFNNIGHVASFNYLYENFIK